MHMTPEGYDDPPPPPHPPFTPPPAPCRYLDDGCHLALQAIIALVQSKLSDGAGLACILLYHSLHPMFTS
jgi:hypothetical protein